MEITHSTTPTSYVRQGRTVVGTQAVPISARFDPLHQGLLIQAAKSNTTVVYVGQGNISADPASEAVGFPMEPGSTMTIPIDNGSLLCAIAADVGQVLFWISI